METTSSATPTTTDSDARLAAFMRLSLVPGVGPRTRQTLLAAFGSPEKVLEAAPSALRELPGIGPKICRAICDARDDGTAATEIAYCRAHGIDIIIEPDEHYPKPLRELPDPPGVLFVRGTLQPSDAVAIAIVGSRHGTQYGLQQAERLAGSLARAGLTIVSGLARGVDAAAHRGALAAGGRTLGVLASGVMNIYPPEHDKLAEEVIASGAIISESPPRAAPLGGNFPQRNRIISGLSLGVIVIEASTRSGALITARHANEQGRDVFALPGRVDNRMAQGCHRLIRDGAKLIESADDVLEELGPLAAVTPARADGREVHHPAELLLNDLEQRVLDVVQRDPTSIDRVITASGLPPHQVLATISVLEMRHLLKRVSGSAVLRL